MRTNRVKLKGYLVDCSEIKFSSAVPAFAEVYVEIFLEVLFRNQKKNLSRKRSHRKVAQMKL